MATQHGLEALDLQTMPMMARTIKTIKADGPQTMSLSKPDLEVIPETRLIQREVRRIPPLQPIDRRNMAIWRHSRRESSGHLPPLNNSNWSSSKGNMRRNWLPWRPPVAEIQGFICSHCLQDQPTTLAFSLTRMGRRGPWSGLHNSSRRQGRDQHRQQASLATLQSVLRTGLFSLDLRLQSSLHGPQQTHKLNNRRHGVDREQDCQFLELTWEEEQGAEVALQLHRPLKSCWLQIAMSNFNKNSGFLHYRIRQYSKETPHTNRQSQRGQIRLQGAFMRREKDPQCFWTLRFLRHTRKRSNQRRIHSH